MGLVQPFDLAPERAKDGQKTARPAACVEDTSPGDQLGGEVPHHGQLDGLLRLSRAEGFWELVAPDVLGRTHERGG